MRYAPDHKQQARERLVTAAGRKFRASGFGGCGVDGLAKEAGVTSGAFYGHFNSKDQAFKAALEAGLEELRLAILSLREELGKDWVTAFVDLYLGPKRTCELSLSCAMQSLTPEVQRAGDAVKEVFETHSIVIAEAIADGLTGSKSQRLQKAWALLALLTGAVTLARASRSGKQGDQIARGARLAALALVVPGDDPEPR